MTIYIYIASSAHPFHADVSQLCICSAHLLDGPPSSKHMNSHNGHAMKIINNSIEHSYMTEKGMTVLTHKSSIIEDRNEKLLYNLEKGHLFSGHNFIHSTLDVRKEVPPKKTLTHKV